MQVLGTALRGQTLHSGRELAAFIDAESGAQLGPIVSGTSDQLELAPLLRAMQPGRRYVCVHTHPDSTAFSPYDVALLLRFPQIQVITAVGADGTWYVLSPNPAAPRPTPADMVAAVAAARVSLSPRYAERVQAGALTRRAARRALSHEVWLHAAGPLGLRYDRIEADRRSRGTR